VVVGIYKNYLVAPLPTAPGLTNSRSRSGFPVTTQSYCGTEASTSKAILANWVADVEPHAIEEAVSPDAIWLMHMPVPGVE
jgi:hypothetical protein